MGQTCHVASMHTACAHDPRGQQANTLHAYVQVSTCKLPWDETCIVLHSSVVHAYTYPLVVSLSPSQCMRNIMQQLMQRVGRVLTRLTTDYKATMISNIYTHTHTHTHIEWLNARSWRTHRVKHTHARTHIPTYSQLHEHLSGAFTQRQQCDYHIPGPQQRWYYIRDIHIRGHMYAHTDYINTPVCINDERRNIEFDFNISIKLCYDILGIFLAVRKKRNYNV